MNTKIHTRSRFAAELSDNRIFRRFTALIAVLLMAVAANAAFAQASDKLRFSIDIANTNSLNTDDRTVVQSLGSENAKQERSVNTVSAPYLGLNLHLNEQWSIGTGYQARHKDTFEITRSTTRTTDRATSSIEWVEMFAERNQKIRGTWSLFTTAGVTRSTVKGSKQVSGEAVSLKSTEIDPIFGVGISSEHGKFEARGSFKRRVASDKYKNLFSVTFRLKF